VRKGVVIVLGGDTVRNVDGLAFVEDDHAAGTHLE
jgi:hypothetical protein